MLCEWAACQLVPAVAYAIWAKHAWETAAAIELRRRRCSRRVFTVLVAVADRLYCCAREWFLHNQRVQHIRNTTWVDVAYRMDRVDLLSCFRATKDNFKELAHAAACPACKASTTPSKYRTSPELRTLIVLRQLASPC